MKVLFLPDYTRANAYQRELARALRAAGTTVVAEPTGRRKILPVLRAVRRLGRPDVIHLHWTEPYISGRRPDVSRARVTRTLAELRLMRRLGSALVWTAHDLTRHDRPVDPMEVAFGRSLVGLSDAVIVHCEAAREALVEAFDLPPNARGRMHVIPHGHYADAYEDRVESVEARERLRLPAQGLVLLFIGWIRPYKGVEDLLTAFAALDDPTARLVIAGQALPVGFGDRIAALAAADDRVVARLGFVPDEGLQVYLNASDVVCLPYREIFTSGSVLLAMTFGRAVIAPRRGCIAEALDERGAILYDSSDANGLSEALRVAHSADLAAMGAHNRSRLVDFDWERIARRTMAVYALATGRRP